MTILVGIVCADGLVIGSDTQESDDWMKRYDVQKIYGTKRFGFTDVELFMGGTGSSAYISRAAELIADYGYAPFFTRPREVADIAEKALGKMRDRYGEDLELELILGVWCKNAPSKEEDEDAPMPFSLYNVFPPEEKEVLGVAEIVTDYTALGSGAPFARYLFDRLHPAKGLSLDKAIQEVVYVIEEVKKVDLYCGGETHVMALRERKLEVLKQERIREIVTALNAADKSIKGRQQNMIGRSTSL